MNYVDPTKNRSVSPGALDELEVPTFYKTPAVLLINILVLPFILSVIEMFKQIVSFIKASV